MIFESLKQPQGECEQAIKDKAVLAAFNITGKAQINRCYHLLFGGDVVLEPEKLCPEN